MIAIHTIKTLPIWRKSIWIPLCFMLGFLLRHSAEAAAAMRESLLLCVKTVLPPLFPFMALTSLCISSGLAQTLGRWLGAPFQALFRLRGDCASAVLLGALAGFPVGAKCAAELYRNGLCDQDEAERLLAFCNNTGPAFLAGGIGLTLWGSASAGFLLYLSQLAAALLTGILLRFTASPGRKTPLPNASAFPNFSTFGLPAVADAITSAVPAALSVCGFVCFFSVFLRMLSAYMPRFLQDSAFMTLLCGFFEVTSGAAAAASLFAHVPNAPAMTLSAVLIGWSGLSVHMQTASLAAPCGLSMKRYWLGKALHSLLCGLVCAALYPLWPV